MTGTHRARRILLAAIARTRGPLGVLALVLAALAAACGAEDTERALHVVTIERQVDRRAGELHRPRDRSRRGQRAAAPCCCASIHPAERLAR